MHRSHTQEVDLKQQRSDHPVRWDRTACTPSDPGSPCPWLRNAAGRWWLVWSRARAERGCQRGLTHLPKPNADKPAAVPGLRGHPCPAPRGPPRLPMAQDPIGPWHRATPQLPTTLPCPVTGPGGPGPPAGPRPSPASSLGRDPMPGAAPGAPPAGLAPCRSSGTGHGCQALSGHPQRQPAALAEPRSRAGPPVPSRVCSGCRVSPGLPEQPSRVLWDGTCQGGCRKPQNTGFVLWKRRFGELQHASRVAWGVLSRARVHKRF